MPFDSGLTDALLVKYFHTGKSDKWIAERHGITVQAVSKRRKKQGLLRKPVVNQVSEALGKRWTVYTTPNRGSHHSAHQIKSLRFWLRRRLGDQTLKPDDIARAERWERQIRRENVVLCYDPTTKKGWYYRPRTPADGRLVIDWPSDWPEQPDENFRRALELPPEPEAESA